ncbi:MAG: hypothetical protein Q9207_002054 [Kuettlingeria erythrocarpa]
MSSSEFKLTDHFFKPTEGRLLPPITLASNVHSPRVAALKQTAPRVANRATHTSVESQQVYHLPSWDGEEIRTQGHRSQDLAAVQLEPQLAYTDTDFRQMSLHKTSRSTELRRQAGRAHVGPHGGPPWIDEQTHSGTSPLLPGPEHVRQEDPTTPPRQPKLRTQAFSREGNVGKAVFGPQDNGAGCNAYPFQQLTTVTSPSKPRLITISPRTPSSKIDSFRPATRFECWPALVSAFSPDTPPETPDVANPIDVCEDPTRPTVEKHVHRGLDSEIYYPITPPTSRVPTPFGRLTSSSCSGNLRWDYPTMTHFDPATAWILQELEVRLRDFPMTALRLNSSVIERIRSKTLGPPAHDKNTARHRSSTAPHSRYSAYKPVVNTSATASSLRQHDASQVTRSSRDIDPNPTAFALQNVFPSARPHHLESLHATYLAFHYVVSLPSSEFVAVSASESAATSYATSAKRSRSSSIISSVPPKVRAMLGLESSAQASTLLPSPAKSWFRASTPDLDRELRMRLENVEMLLESSVRKILVDVQGRSLRKQDDALVRAVGEIVKIGGNR